MKKKPVVFVFHKLLDSKEFELPLAYYLALNNHYVVAFDFPFHGDHKESFYVTNNFDFNNVFEAMPVMLENIKTFIKYLKENQPDADAENITVIGVSLGGMIAYTAGYTFPEIKTVIPTISSASWSILIEKSTFNNLRFFSKTKEVIDKSRVNPFIEKYEPIHHIEDFSFKRFILINGCMDTTFPITFSEPFYEKLKYHYEKNGHANKLTWLKYPKYGHTVPYIMIYDIIENLKINIGE